MENTTKPGNFFTSYFMNRELSVLLVDDNRVNQFLGKRILQNLGITNVELAGNGHDAFNLIKGHRFDVLLTDVEMPGMNGYELSKAIRAHQTSESRITIIALTANAAEDDRQQARDAGIDDYLTKPYSPQDLQEMLQKYLPQKDQMIMEEIITIKHTNTEEGIARIYEMFHHNKDDVKHFLYMLSGQIPQLLHEIKVGILDSDWDTTFQASHKLKSPVKMLSSDPLIDKISFFTEAIRQRKDLDQAPALFEELAPAIESLLVMVNKELESLG